MTDWIGEIEARANAATAGPWVWDHDHWITSDEYDGSMDGPCDCEIKHGYTHIGPDLLNEPSQRAWEKYCTENPNGGHNDPTMPPAPIPVLVSWGYDADGLRVTQVDAAFIAAARTDIPRLCATLRAVEALLPYWDRRAEEADLDYYASQYDSHAKCAAELRLKLRHPPGPAACRCADCMEVYSVIVQLEAALLRAGTPEGKDGTG
jgi:hypothetical protein